MSHGLGSDTSLQSWGWRKRVTLCLQVTHQSLFVGIHRVGLSHYLECGTNPPKEILLYIRRPSEAFWKDRTSLENELFITPSC